MRFLAIVLMSLFLSGCTALLVGGAAVGGYQVGKDDRTAAQIARDAKTTATIKSKMVADKTVSAINVNVDTYDNRVTLSGSVGSFVARDQAGRIAAGVEGVVSVDNQLKVVAE
ncbi:MAG TPA: BON domain-containing protein [Woeseiaceae bacterium]